MITNTYHVRKSAWNRWTEEGRSVFNMLYSWMGMSTEDPLNWNTAFFAACEASGLSVQFEPKGGWNK